VAAHCCAFLEPVTQDEILNLEKWAPYLRWLSRLTPADDTVVTFNYDRVLERLSEAACLDYITGFQIVANEDSEHRADGRRPLVLKLHGSVDWELIDGKQSGEWLFRSTRQADFAIHCPPERLAIAVPGRSKLPRSRSFDVLWRMAETAIQEAEEIYFLGYRFPPSDIEAQKRILGALAKARNVKIRVVLGKSHDDSARLKDLIEIYTDKTPRVFSLTAEEYIQAWSERA
jgi:hypothetical protein